MLLTRIPTLVRLESIFLRDDHVLQALGKRPGITLRIIRTSNGISLLEFEKFTFLSTNSTIFFHQDICRTIIFQLPLQVRQIPLLKIDGLNSSGF